MDCTARVAPGEPIAPHLVEGAVICLAPGRHAGGLDVAVSLTLSGEPGAVLDGEGRRPVIRVGEHEKQVVIKDLELTNGAAEFGSGLAVEGYSEVLVENVTFSGNRRGQGNAAGLGVRRGTVTVRNSRFGPEDDVVVTTVSEVSFDETTIEGDVRVLEGAKVAFEGGSVRGRLIVRGTTTRHPTVTLSGVEVADLQNDDELPGEVTQR